MAAPDKGRRLAGARDMTTPFVKARQFLREPGEHHDDLPLARPSLAVAREVFHDELVMLGMRMFTPVGDAATPVRIDCEVTEALEFYASRGWLSDPAGFFAAPRR